MSPDVAAFAQVSMIIVALTGSLSAIALGAFLVVRRATRVQRPPVDDQRLEHLQQSVDAIAVEVERIAEAQRFTAKLLADRTRDFPGESQRSLKG